MIPFKSLAILPWRMAFPHRMKIHISNQQQIDSYKYAVKIVEIGKAYKRFNETKEQQIERWYLGKLGEIVFFNLLAKNDIHVDYSELFKFEADEYDFIMPNQDLKIDVKTCKPFDRYLLVPEEQTNNKAEIDIYVAAIVDEKNSIGFIDGYIWKKNLIKNSDPAVSKNMPEGRCYNSKLCDLKNINKLFAYWYF